MEENSAFSKSPILWGRQRNLVYTIITRASILKAFSTPNWVFPKPSVELNRPTELEKQAMFGTMPENAEYHIRLKSHLASKTFMEVCLLKYSIFHLMSTLLFWEIPLNNCFLLPFGTDRIRSQIKKLW